MAKRLLLVLGTLAATASCGPADADALAAQAVRAALGPLHAQAASVRCTAVGSGQFDCTATGRDGSRYDCQVTGGGHTYEAICARHRGG